MHQAIFVPSASTISNTDVDINASLTNAVAVRVLDSTATTEITRLDLSLSATPTGSFTSDSLNVEVSTANRSGYILYMNSNFQDTTATPVAYTTDLVNQMDSAHTVPTLAANTTKQDFSTAQPDTPNANKWGYSLDDTTYRPVPANTNPTQIATTDAPAASSLTPVYIGANVNLEMPDGTYKNKLTFSAVANPIPTEYTLSFEPGTTDTVENLPEDITVSEASAAHVFTIPSTTPSRDGYMFTGYSDGTTTYQAGDTITVLSEEDYTGSATLTAQWVVAALTVSVTNTNTTSGAASITIPYGGSSTVTVTPDTGYYLSSVSCPSGYTCTGYNTGTSATGQQTVTVTNNNTESGGTLAFTGAVRTFTVSVTNSNTTSGSSSLSIPYNGSRTVTVKPTSGYYLSSVSCPSGYTCTGYSTGVNATSQQTVTVTNSGTTSGGTLRFYGTLRKTLNDITNMQEMTDDICKATTIGTTKTLTDTRDSKTYSVGKLKDGDCWMLQNLRLVGPLTLTTSDSSIYYGTTVSLPASTAPSSWCDDETASCYERLLVYDTGNSNYGAYYNWYTATAERGNFTKTSGDVYYSICPKGWDLDGSYWYTRLVDNYTASELLSSPPNFKLSGRIINKAVDGQGSKGYYWTATASSSTTFPYAARLLVLESTTASANLIIRKNQGSTIRCRVYGG